MEKSKFSDTLSKNQTSKQIINTDHLPSRSFFLQSHSASPSSAKVRFYQQSDCSNLSNISITHLQAGFPTQSTTVSRMSLSSENEKTKLKIYVDKKMNKLRVIESQTKSLALMESIWVFKLGLIVLLTRQSHFVLHFLTVAPAFDLCSLSISK